jgi:hypothetical protein
VSRTLSALEVADLLDRSAELRRYTVRLSVVEHVDNQGTQCEYCGDTDALVAANVYATDYQGDTHCADTCPGCIVYFVDGHLDTNPNQPVTIEIARGVR